jgi:hypothetical protein
MADIDLEQVLREIDEEVAARRASGDFPPGMERDLDLVFARFAPATTSGDDLDALIEQADRGAFVDVDVPTASRLPAVAYVKKLLRKLMSWYLRYLAQQVSVFAASVVGALKLLGRRVEALEASTPGANPAVRDASLRAASAIDASAFEDAVAAALSGVAGRVLVAESGDGALVARLRRDGLDAYGCDPRVDVAPAGIEIRSDDVVEHLHAVDADALGALVLVGLVDRVPVGVQLALVEHAARVVAAGGRVAIVGTVPAAWGRTTSVVEADLAPGKPLHAETWAHLLTEHGFAGVSVQPGERTYVVTATRQR